MAEYIINIDTMYMQLSELILSSTKLKAKAKSWLKPWLNGRIFGKNTVRQVLM